ncbi:MAG: hypothetical protein AB7U20_01780 [Planctomycetaceae bacterium]
MFVNSPFSVSRLGWFRSSIAGVASLLVMSGCGGGGGGDYAPVTAKDVEHAESHVHDHDHHAHAAPHGGHLIELGEHQYNAEIVLEAEAGRLVVYVLDAHAENAFPVPLEQIEFSVEGGAPITLTAEPQDGEPEGQSSRFVAAGAAVTFGDIEELHGSLKIEINGSSYTGALTHDHDEHDHDHAHE